MKPEFGISEKVLPAHKARRMVAVSAKMQSTPYRGPYEPAHYHILRYR
jgi:hypothetical protein